MLNNHNQHIIADRLKSFHANDERLGVLLALSVGRLMMRALNQSRDLRDDFPDDKVRHVADWLKAAINNDVEWLRNVDNLNRPKKLLKHGSFGTLLAEVDRAMLIEAQKLSNVKLIQGDEELYATLYDGMSLIRLMTPAALDRESAEMQHCIGNGGYDDHLDSHIFLSLRDSNGKAHVTLDIVDNVIIQMHGKQNKPPIRRYVDALTPFLKAKGFAVRIPISHLESPSKVY